MRILEICALWFEDNEEWLEEVIPVMKGLLLEDGYILKIDVHHNAKELPSISDDQLNNYDLILSDLVMETDKEGADIIESIRQRKVLLPIIFYSANGISDLAELLKERVLQGVFLLNRKDTKFEENVKQHIYSSIHKVNSLGVMQGLVLSAVAELDDMHFDILVKQISKAKDGNKLTSYIQQIKDHLLKKRETYYTTATNNLNECSEDGFINYAKSTKNFSTFERYKFIRDEILKPEEKFKQGGEKELITKVLDGTKHIGEIIEHRNKLAHWKVTDYKITHIEFESEKDKYTFNKQEALRLRKDLLTIYEHLSQYKNIK